MREFEPLSDAELSEKLSRGGQQAGRRQAEPGSGRWSVPEIRDDDHHRDERWQATTAKDPTGIGPREANVGHGPGWSGRR